MKNIFYMLLLGWICCIAGCKCGDCEDPSNPDCKNYNPCHDAKKVTASFKIIVDKTTPNRGVLNFTEEVLEGDTVNSQNFTFEANYPNATQYIWKVGRDARTWNSRKFSLSIGELVPIPVTLIVVGPPNTGCFPNDDGRDTVTRVLYFEGYTGPPKQGLFGRFRGTDNIRTEPYEIVTGIGFIDSTRGTEEVYWENLPFGLNTNSTRASTLNEGGHGATIYTGGFDRWISPTNTGQYPYRLSGSLRLSKTNRDSITIEYYYGLNLDPWWIPPTAPKVIFKGKRVWE